MLMEYVSSLLIERVCEKIETRKLILLKSHALFKADTEDPIRQAQISFIVQPIIEQYRLLKTVLGVNRYEK